MDPYQQRQRQQQYQAPYLSTTDSTGFSITQATGTPPRIFISYTSEPQPAAIVGSSLTPLRGDTQALPSRSTRSQSSSSSLPPPASILPSQPVEAEPAAPFEFVRPRLPIPRPVQGSSALSVSPPDPPPTLATSPPSADPEFSNPPPRFYSLPSFESMTDPRRVTQAEKQQMINALRTHSVNNITDLRRIERALAALGTPDVQEPMTSAWTYYVNYHSLLTELRGLTKNYPFSSDCIDEAKRRVYADPASNRSWNMAWLVLVKIQTDQLIPYYARHQASQPAMWGGQTPSAENINQLSNAFVAEWNWALGQMLRHWEQPPSR